MWPQIFHVTMKEKQVLQWLTIVSSHQLINLAEAQFGLKIQAASWWWFIAHRDFFCACLETQNAFNGTRSPTSFWGKQSSQTDSSVDCQILRRADSWWGWLESDGLRFVRILLCLCCLSLVTGCSNTFDLIRKFDKEVNVPGSGV